ncbi:MAG: hypothetical protein ACXWW7_08495 [Nocardioides sp.]
MLIATGCGHAEAPMGQDPVAAPYDGPLSVSADPGDETRPVMKRAGAAGLALECDWQPVNGGAGDYVDGGLYEVQDSPAKALATYLDAEAWAYQLPVEGYRVEREDEDRVLFSYDVDERTTIAFIAADGMRDWNDGEGWGIESWAQCDPFELPADVTDALGIGVWTDDSGARVPTPRIRSFQGAEHCDWQDITFVMLGPKRDGEQFVRDTTGELDQLMRSTYDGSAKLPDDATDTGLQRDGRQLWLDPGHGAAYLVRVDDPADVERWPAAREPIYCA